MIAGIVREWSKDCQEMAKHLKPCLLKLVNNKFYVQPEQLAMHDYKQFSQEEKLMKELPETMKKIKIQSRQDFFDRQRIGQKRRWANKEQERRRAVDLNFCMELPDGEVVQLTDDFLKEWGGPLPANVWAADLKNNPKLRIQLEWEEGDEEANREIFELLFDRAEEVGTTYTIKNW